MSKGEIMTQKKFRYTPTLQKFTYNQIILFFNENKLPLSPEQIRLIGTKARKEYEDNQILRQKQEASWQKRELKRIEREDEKDRKKSIEQGS